MDEFMLMIVGSSTDVDVYFIARVIAFTLIIEFVGYLTTVLFQVIRR